jgi:hypothetical protein
MDGVAHEWKLVAGARATLAKSAAWLRASRENAAHSLFEEAREIADEAPLVIEHKGESVEIKFDHAAVAPNRERIRVRERAAAKLLPRVYSDRQTFAIGGAPDLPPLGSSPGSKIELGNPWCIAPVD